VPTLARLTAKMKRLEAAKAKVRYSRDLRAEKRVSINILESSYRPGAAQKKNTERGRRRDEKSGEQLKHW